MNNDIDIWNAINSLFDESMPPKPPEAEKAMIEMIMKRVAELMRGDMDLLLSHLYRLDIDERKVEKILFDPNRTTGVEYALARLIWERQKKRMQTKKAYRSFPCGDIPEDYKW